MIEQPTFLPPKITAYSSDPTQLERRPPTLAQNLLHAGRWFTVQLRIFFQPRERFLARLDQQLAVAR